MLSRPVWEAAEMVRRTTVYSSLTKQRRVTEVVRALTTYTGLHFHWWIHAVAVFFGGVAWLAVPGWPRWVAAGLVVAVPWLIRILHAFRGPNRRRTLATLGQALAPKRSFRKHRERLEHQLYDLRFTVFGVEGPGPHTIVGHGGDPDLDMLDLAHGEIEGTGPLVRVATLVLGEGDEPEHHRWSLEGQLRYLDRPPPSADGLSPEEWAEAVGQHRSAVEAGPSLRWERATVDLDGRPVPAEVTRSGRCSAAMITFDRHLVTVLARDVALADLDLRPVDPGAYYRPW